MLLGLSHVVTTTKMAYLLLKLSYVAHGNPVMPQVTQWYLQENFMEIINVVKTLRLHESIT